MLVLSGISGLLIAALGGGLFGQQQPSFLQWQHRLFSGLCHQLPQRSFCINGQPMAVCSRCFGIYSSFGLGWLGLPLLAQLKERLIPSARTLLIAAVFLNILDFLGNLLGFWHNTLVSRMVAGSTVGLLAATFLSTSFFHIN